MNKTQEFFHSPFLIALNSFEDIDGSNCFSMAETTSSSSSSVQVGQSCFVVVLILALGGSEFPFLLHLGVSYGIL